MSSLQEEQVQEKLAQWPSGITPGQLMPIFSVAVLSMGPLLSDSLLSWLQINTGSALSPVLIHQTESRGAETMLLSVSRAGTMSWKNSWNC